MTSFNPSEPRVPAGGSAGGQWGAPSAAKKKTTAKSTAKPTAKTSAKPTAKGKAPSSARGKTPPGTARNAAAAKVQADPKAQQLYGQLMQAGQHGAYARGLSTDDLKLLTQMVYSSRTSDPSVVAARMAVANEMARRGLDVKQFGALGGGLPAGRVNTLQKKVAARKVAPRAAAKPAVKSVARAAARPVAKPVTKAPAAAPSSSIGRFRPM